MKRTTYELKRELQNYTEQYKKLNEDNITYALEGNTEAISRTEKEIENIKSSMNVLRAEIERREKETVIVPIKKDDPVESRAVLYRSVLNNEPIPEEIRRSLFGVDTTPPTGGNNLLPTNLSNELIHEKVKNNPVRDIATITNIVGLEIPRVAYSIDDIEFVKEGEVAKELELKGDKVKFGSFGFRISTEVSDSLLNGTNTNLVEYIEKALKEGLSKKEKHCMFKTDKEDEKHMNIYSEANGIKKITGQTLFDAIKKSLSDLQDDFYHNATIVMRKNDYFDMIEELSNKNTNFFEKQSEKILGIDVVFCEDADKPIIGDFNYLHLNYSADIKLESERKAREGRNFFILSGEFDIRVVLSSAFRIAEAQATRANNRTESKNNKLEG